MSAVDTSISQRRALVDRLVESCLVEVDNIASKSYLPYSEKNELLDGMVYTCLSTLPTMFMPLSKHSIAVRLFLAMIEEMYSDATGVPLSHDFSKIMSTRSDLVKCLRKVASALIVGKLNVYKASNKNEEDIDEVSEVDAKAREELRRGVPSIVFTAENVKELARSVDSLVNKAVASIDLVDAELALDEAIDKLNLLLADKDLRKYVASVIDEDPLRCLSERIRKYEEAKQGDSHISASASWVDRVYEDYQKCVQFSQDKPPCDGLLYIQDREVCARSKCAIRLISLIPGILERLGITTIVSQVVTK